MQSRATADGPHGHAHGAALHSRKAQTAGCSSEQEPTLCKGGPSSVSQDGLKRRSATTSREDTQPPTHLATSIEQGDQSGRRKLVLAYLNLIADGVHNFTDGMAIAAAFVQGGPSLGWARAVIILVHELPQEVGDYGMLLAAGMSSARALAWNFISVRVVSRMVSCA